MRRVLPVLYVIVHLIAACAAQSTLDVLVSDQQGSPVPGAEIVVKHGPAETHATTDQNGTHRFLALAAGEYEVRATSDGYFSAETEIALKPRQPASLQIELAPRQQTSTTVEVRSADIALGETTSSRLLTHSEIAALPDTAKRDIPTLSLYTFPGATLSHDNYVHVHGNEVSLQESINGVSFLENPQQQFSAGLTPEMFQTVNMISGSFPAEYGNRFGGIVDMTTRSGQDLAGHGSVELGGGTFNTNNGFAEYGFTRGRFGFYASAGAFTSDWFLNPPEPQPLHDFGFGAVGARNRARGSPIRYSRKSS